MVWLPEAEGKKTFVNMFTRFDRIHERDGRTDGRTGGHHTKAWAAMMYSIAGQKRNLNAQDIDETEMFTFLFETKPKASKIDLETKT